MKKIGIFYGSSTDNTTTAAEFIKDYLEMNGHLIDMYNIADVDPEKILEYSNIIIGCPTWHIGELQEDWDSIFSSYEILDFNGKIAAFFGCGDQIGYPGNFLDAIGILAIPFVKNGGKLIGKCSIEAYQFTGSKALDNNDKLMGLGLDYDNDDEQTCEDMMIMWLEDIIEDFK